MTADDLTTDVDKRKCQIHNTLIFSQLVKLWYLSAIYRITVVNTVCVPVLCRCNHPFEMDECRFGLVGEETFKSLHHNTSTNVLNR